jgi:protocatechuate 3,4-dioxygenase alpha subunit
MTGTGEGREALVATGSQTVGPFFHFGLTAAGAINAVAPPAHLPRVDLRVRVSDGQGQPVTDAIVEIFYAAEAAASLLFARLPTGADGSCTFAIAPPVPQKANGESTPHVNVCLFARGLLRHLHTRIYFDHDIALHRDAVLELVPESRRPTLMARPDGANRWTFELRLQGVDETVFFDL